MSAKNRLEHVGVNRAFVSYQHKYRSFANIANSE